MTIDTQSSNSINPYNMEVQFVPEISASDKRGNQLRVEMPNKLQSVNTHHFGSALLDPASVYSHGWFGSILK